MRLNVTFHFGLHSWTADAHIKWNGPCRFGPTEILGAIHSTKISGNFGPKLNGSVRSNLKSFEKTGPPFEGVLFSRLDRSGFWLNGSRLFGTTFEGSPL